MSESETALLRKELAKVVAENRDWQMRVARFEAAFAKREEMLEAEIDRLRLRLQSATGDWPGTRTPTPRPPQIRCTMPGARRLPEADRMTGGCEFKGKLGTDPEPDGRQDYRTVPAGGRPRGTRENPTETGPRGP